MNGDNAGNYKIKNTGRMEILLQKKRMEFNEILEETLKIKQNIKIQ